MKVGYIGLGAMGGALAMRMLKSSDLSVFDLNGTAIASLVAAGATGAPDARTLARGADVVVICLPRSSHVEQLLFGPDGIADALRAGSLLIDQTSGDPAETRRFAGLLAQRDVALVDAPVSGGTAGAKAGTITIMLGAAPAHEARAREVLARISPNIFTCGGIGAGQVMKLVNNTISTCNRFATLEAVALGRRNGLELGVMTDVLNAGGARSRTTENLLPSILHDTGKADFAASLMLKDVTLATGLAGETGAPLTFGHLARAMLQAVVNTYGAEASIDEIATLVAEQAAVSLQ